MAHRSFVDRGGVPWDVWEVKPEWADRRSGVDRRQLTLDDPRADPPVIEQRRGPERRVGTGKRVPRLKMGEQYSAGWLAFESSSERRRLSPIPPGWDQLGEPVLASLCEKANPVTVRRGRLID
jgi:hypothetical protein